MAKTARVTECPFPMHKSRMEKIEQKAEELGLSEAHIFNVAIEEGIESLMDNR